MRNFWYLLLGSVSAERLHLHSSVSLIVKRALAFVLAPFELTFTSDRLSCSLFRLTSDVINVMMAGPSSPSRGMVKDGGILCD